MAHITGGGFIENIPRVLPDGVNVEIEYGSWPILPIFKLMQEKGSITNRDMFTTFNMGIGMVVVVAADQAEEALRIAREHGEEAYRIGTLRKAAAWLRSRERTCNGSACASPFSLRARHEFPGAGGCGQKGKLDVEASSFLSVIRPQAPVVERARKAGWRRSSSGRRIIRLAKRMRAEILAELRAPRHRSDRAGRLYADHYDCAG